SNCLVNAIVARSVEDRAHAERICLCHRFCHGFAIGLPGRVFALARINEPTGKAREPREGVDGARWLARGGSRSRRDQMQTPVVELWTRSGDRLFVGPATVEQVKVDNSRDVAAGGRLRQTGLPHTPSREKQKKEDGISTSPYAARAPPGAAAQLAEGVEDRARGKRRGARSSRGSENSGALRSPPLDGGRHGAPAARRISAVAGGPSEKHRKPGPMFIAAAALARRRNLPPRARSIECGSCRCCLRRSRLRPAAFLSRYVVICSPGPEVDCRRANTGLSYAGLGGNPLIGDGTLPHFPVDSLRSSAQGWRRARRHDIAMARFPLRELLRAGNFAKIISRVESAGVARDQNCLQYYAVALAKTNQADRIVPRILELAEHQQQQQQHGQPLIDPQVNARMYTQAQSGALPPNQPPAKQSDSWGASWDTCTFKPHFKDVHHGNSDRLNLKVFPVQLFFPQLKPKTRLFRK
ncbi:MAG: hypothetical protein BJ554DRAFT_7107, partial [Olpidium bornovanus]